jgi:hypothetical protein
MVNLSIIPEGWFLHGIGECVTPVQYRHDTHESTGEGFWCELQYRDGGGKLTKAKGLTPELALSNAVVQVERHWPDFVP